VGGVLTIEKAGNGGEFGVQALKMSTGNKTSIHFQVKRFLMSDLLFEYFHLT